MNLDDVKMENLLPFWMKENPDDVALAKQVNKAIRKLYATSQLLTTWDKLDQLPEEVLDRLAWELDVDWYDSGASKETKVALIRDSEYIHSKKGTVAAVEKVIKAYFGDEKLMEWFEYGGDPHHFKVFTTNPNLVAQNLEKFLYMLEKVKRKSSKLDAIMIGLTGIEYVYLGAANRIFEHPNIMIPGKNYVLMDSANIKHENITVTINDSHPRTDMMGIMLYGARPAEHIKTTVAMRSSTIFNSDALVFTRPTSFFVQRKHITVRIGAPS